MTSMQQVVSLYRLGELEQALELLGRLPPSAQRNQAWIRLLIQRRAVGDLQTARKLANEWHRMQPGNPEPLQRLVEIALFKSQPGKAAEAVDRLNRTAPGHPVTLLMQGVVLQLQNHPKRALKAFLEAERRPARLAASAKVRALLRMLETAAGNYPGSPAKDDLALLNEVELVGRLEQALLDWQNKAAEQPGGMAEDDRRDFSNAWYNLGCRAMADFDRLAQCIRCFDRAIELAPDNLLAITNRLFAMNYSTRVTPGELSQAHRAFGQWLSSRFPSISTESARDVSTDRLVVAYLSSDFRQHSVAHYILPVLQHHDLDRFEVHLYHTDARQDLMTQRIRNTGAHYHQVAGTSDTELKALITRHGVDVLVELNGLTEGHRLSLLAQRAAPVQVSWIGYPNTTGLPTVDFRLVDPVTDPVAESQDEQDRSSDNAGTERLYRLPGIFSVYAFPGDLPEVGSAPCLANGFVTFGSFNNLAKLNQPTVGLWAKLLQAVPGSRLLIKNIALDYRLPRERLVSAFMAQGIESSRIELHGRVADQLEHLQYFNRVDICLDSFPYNGTTTNCDSLLMGVPFVTLKGVGHRSRVGASQLVNLGLEEWVAEDEASFIAILTSLASDYGKLAGWRGQLRSRMRASPLMDAEKLTREVERAYKNMWIAEHS